MSEINDLIINKLKAWPPDVAKLAVEAVRLSETLPEVTVSEQLQSVVRNLVRDNEVDNDSA